jgi:hypothetical protein
VDFKLGTDDGFWKRWQVYRLSRKVPHPKVVTMDEGFMKERARYIRNLAEKADPFVKRRLLDLAVSYESRLGRPSQATVSLPSNQPSEGNLDHES